MPARLIRRTRTVGDAISARRAAQPEDAGAVLVLALLFMVVIGLLVGGIAAWTSNDLNDTARFASARGNESVLDSASQLAIQSIRYTPLLGQNQTLNANPPSYCWGSSAPSQYASPTNPSDTVDVWCTTTWNPTSANTRVVQIYSCLTSVTTSAATCAQSPGLQTEVTFDDYSTSLSPPNPGVCTNTCGAGMTINSWVMPETDPTVSAISPSTGPDTGNTTVTVTGSGFVANNTTVEFVGSTSQDNLVIAGTQVSVSSPTTLTVVTPAVTTLISSGYYVVVSTPAGQSNSGQGPAFKFTPTTPQITSIWSNTSPPDEGSANGGTALSITGSGFLNPNYGDNTVVSFVDTANPAIVLQSPSLTVNSSTSITATTPAITTGSTYYVVVTTYPNGTSTPNSGSDIFTYTPYYPVAAAISPASGTGPTSVSVTGFGFLSGSTAVNLLPTSGTGSTIALTGVSVSSSSQLTATVPQQSGNTSSYYVQVVSTWNGTQYTSCNLTGSGGVPACSNEGAPTYQY